MSTKGTIYIDKALENVALGYKNADMIAGMIMPSITVGVQGGKVHKFGKEAFRLESDKRAPGTSANKVSSYSVSSDSYFCDSHAVQDVIPMEDQINADPAVNPEIAVTESLVAKIMLRREYTSASLLFNSSNFSSATAALTGADRWDDDASNPLKKVSDAMEAVRGKTGAKPNTIVMGSAVYEKLRLHPDLVNKFQYTSGGVLTEEQVKAVLGVKNLLIGKAVYNSATEGATEVMADVWGKSCLIAHIAEAPGLRVPSLGYSYRWNTGTGGYQVYKTVEDEAGSRHATIIEVQSYFDDIILDKYLGYLYTTVVS